MVNQAGGDERIRSRQSLAYLRLPLVLCVFLAAPACAERPTVKTPGWVGTWAAAPQLPEPHNVPPPPGVAGSTLRQVARVSAGGDRVRVRLSNEFGRDSLTLEGRIALSGGGSSILPATDRALTFSGKTLVTIPAGAPMLSDPLEMHLEPLASVAITLFVSEAPADITSHPGSRCTSYLQEGRHLAAWELPEAVKVEHWYLLSGIDVYTGTASGAITVLGDSITDGRGSTTDQNRRWTDFLAERLSEDSEVGVLNLGMGGNRVLQDGLGPNALARLDRDVLAQSGVRWLIVLEGINDIGTADLGTSVEISALVERLTGAYEQIIERARSHGIAVVGGTLLPFEGSFYFTPEREAVRRAVNEWIRTAGRFDEVVDFEQATRDPARPGHLLPDLDCGDHLHLNDLGYRTMAEAANRVIRSHLGSN
ncbi:MAG TPA: SGNH/GDSL hydrolase family protein [Acidobacteriota bacterium]|nr:SGNH/GDSL hydrolase family protein [Acidobacteriota bacterium]